MVERRQGRQRGSLAAREARLAYWMLAPTFLIVFAIVLFPVLADIWISFKPITLADLRPPTAVVRERLRSEPAVPGDVLTIRYQLRNSSRTVALDDVSLADTLPAGLAPSALDARCTLLGQDLTCELGEYEPGFRASLDLDFITSAEYFASAADPLASEPRMRANAPNILTNLVFTLDNYRRYLTGPDFWNELRTTLAYTIFGTIGSILLGLFAAQLLNANFAGKGFLRGLFLFPYVAPIIAVAFTWAFLLDPLSGSINALGLHYELWDRPLNFLGQRSLDLELLGVSVTVPLALTTVIMFEAWRYFPFAFLFILARFQAIPSEMYEAASVDGASPLQKFRFITLPQLVGILSTLFLLRFIWTFNKFDDIYLLTGGAAGTKTLTVAVFDNAFARQDLGAGAAVAVVLFVILAIFMAIYFRFAPQGE